MAFRFLRSSDLHILAGIGTFYVFGYLLNNTFELTRLNDPFRWNWWFFNEAIVMYAFYLLGVLLRRRGVFHSGADNLLRDSGLAVAAALVVWITYDLNQGPFALNIPAVVILASGHGHILWFPITAVIGSLGILLLGRLSVGIGWMSFLGQNALILFCLNGVFYHHLNGPFAGWFVGSMPQGGLSVGLAAALGTALSLLIALPILLALSRWVPQLTGRPSAEGPLLPPLQK